MEGKSAGEVESSREMMSSVRKASSIASRGNGVYTTSLAAQQDQLDFYAQTQSVPHFVRETRYSCTHRFK